MPKATIEFSLPEEQTEFQNASNGWRWKLVVGQIVGVLRQRLKHNSNPEWDSDTVEQIQTRIHDLIKEENLNLYE
jgi:hypothetical protein